MVRFKVTVSLPLLTSAHFFCDALFSELDPGNLQVCGSGVKLDLVDINKAQLDPIASNCFNCPNRGAEQSPFYRLVKPQRGGLPSDLPAEDSHHSGAQRDHPGEGHGLLFVPEMQ